MEQWKNILTLSNQLALAEDSNKGNESISGTSMDITSNGTKALHTEANKFCVDENNEFVNSGNFKEENKK
jgi:hypothetical protein